MLRRLPIQSLPNPPKLPNLINLNAKTSNHPKTTLKPKPTANANFEQLHAKTPPVPAKPSGLFAEGFNKPKGDPAKITLTIYRYEFDCNDAVIPTSSSVSSKNWETSSMTPTEI